MAFALLLLPAWVPAQDWSGASLRAARTLRLPPGYQVDVLAVGFRLPQDLALEPPDGLWLLTQADPVGRGAGALVRLPVDGPTPLEAARLAAISIPFSPDPARFRMGSLARHPATGDLFVAERLGRHIIRVSPSGQSLLYARGANLLADSRSLAFDANGRLLVLDFTGRRVVAEVGPSDPLDAPGDRETTEFPLLYRLDVDEPLPVPRNLEYATRVFPPAAFRRRDASVPRYVGVLALPTGDVILSGVGGDIDRLRPDGTVASIAKLATKRVVAVGGHGELYAVDFLGGQIVQILADGAVRPFAEGLARPAAVAVDPNGTVFVAEDTGRVLRLRPTAGASR
ncbi:MAG: hypothetical protein ACRELA_22165 [Candidatus Rokuibacteriota bacterium]